MNIESSNVKKFDNNKQQAIQPSSKNTNENTKFADELNILNETKNIEAISSEKVSNTEQENSSTIEDSNNSNVTANIEKNKVELKLETSLKPVNECNNPISFKNNKPNQTDNQVNGFKNQEQKNSNNIQIALNDIENIVEEFLQSEDKKTPTIKIEEDSTDNNNMINNDFNINENKDILPQMSSSMNFSGDGQPFSSFMNNETKQNQDKKLTLSAKDLAEEQAILSTMAENIAIANKNNIEVQPTEKTVQREEGIKKIDIPTGITIETVVKYDSVIMNQADVEVFANIVENGGVNINEVTTENLEKSVKISKTLSDLLAKAKENNQPLRIDFDNNISIIIKISRDGKISADFLPSSQVAEMYLKENLPLLRQRFDENNIKYDELNQRERRDQNKEQNKKKGRNDE